MTSDSPWRLRRKHIGAVGLVLALGLLGSWSVHAVLSGKKPDPAFTVELVQREDIEESVTATGTLQAIELVNVGTQVTGAVKALHVTLGEHVTKGQLIAEIDDSTQRNALRQAEAQKGALQAQMRAKESVLKQALLVLQRQKGMYKHGVASREAYEVAENAVEVARADIDALKAQLEEASVALDTANVNLGYTRIVSPMDGVVVAVVTQQGQTLNASTSAPVVVKVARMDKMKIRADISEADVVRVAPGQKAFFTTLGEPDRQRTAVLKGVELAPDSMQSDSSPGGASAVYYSGLLETPNPDGTLRVGMTVQIRIVLRQQSGVLTVPSAALQQRGANGRRSISVLNATGRVQQQWITVGLDNKTRAQVVDGLSEADRVVVQPTPPDSTSQGSAPAP